MPQLSDPLSIPHPERECKDVGQLNLVLTKKLATQEC